MPGSHGDHSLKISPKAIGGKVRSDAQQDSISCRAADGKNAAADQCRARGVAGAEFAVQKKLIDFEMLQRCFRGMQCVDGMKLRSGFESFIWQRGSVDRKAGFKQGNAKAKRFVRIGLPLKCDVNGNCRQIKQRYGDGGEHNHRQTTLRFETMITVFPKFP